MLPLSWLLFAWLGLIGIFLLVSLITLFTLLRFGLASFITYVSTLAFIGVSAVALLLASSYLVRVDWTQTLDLGSIISPIFDIPTSSS